jgi:predicted aspartyl protease
MGMFEVNVKLANLTAPSETEELSLLVDTGATLSWIPRAILEKLGVQASRACRLRLQMVAV